MKLAKAFFTVLAVAGMWACSNTCATGSVCGTSNTVISGPSGTPTPTPFPLPGSTPDPCRVESIRVGFHSGAQLPFVAVGTLEQLDATPFNSSGEVPKGCNLTREPLWMVLTPLTCQITGGGYNPFLRGLKVGTCTLAASMVNVSSFPFSVDIR